MATAVGVAVTFDFSTIETGSFFLSGPNPAPITGSMSDEYFSKSVQRTRMSRGRIEGSDFIMCRSASRMTSTCRVAP